MGETSRHRSEQEEAGTCRHILELAVVETCKHKSG